MEEKFYKAFKADVFIKREEKLNHMKLSAIRRAEDAAKRLEDDLNGGGIGGLADDDDSVVRGEGKFSLREEEEERKRKEEEEEELQQSEAEQLRLEENMFALSMCRVLHIGAAKISRSKGANLFNPKLQLR